MKKKSLIATAVVIGVMGSAYKIADDILQKLGVQKQNAEYAIMSNLLNVAPPDPDCSGDCGQGRLYIPRATSLSAIISGDKKTAARELCEYVKEYTQSSEFSENYQKKRESAKPYNERPNTPNPEYLKSIQNSIKEFEAEYKKTKDPQTKKIYGDMITTFKKNYKEASDPTPLTTAWKEKYPETVDSVIRKQLNFYLSEQATVDFSAQTVLKGRIKYFVKPEYEKKSATWKTIYRAGKEVNDVVTAFVKDWLKSGITTANITKPDTNNGTTSPSTTNTKTTETAKTNGINTKAEEPQKSNTVSPKADSVKPKKSLLNKVKGKIGL